MSILTADCLPIAVYDPKTKTIGLIHVSRHNLKKIVKSTIEALKKKFNINPKNLVVNIGPSIGPCNYEIDLWEKVEKELTRLKVLKKNIYNPRICTFESSDYFSHRKSKSRKLPDNRFATIFGPR